MALDPTLRDQLAKTIHDAACRCGGPIHHRHYLTAADKAAELLTTQPAPIVLPTVDEVRNLLIAADPQNDGIDHVNDLSENDRAIYARMARKVLDLIASRVRHWVPVEPEDPRVAVVNEWLQEPWPPIADLLARLDALEADR